MVTSQYDIMMSGEVMVCVGLSIRNKKGTLGQKDRTILETREVRERSGVFMLSNSITLSKPRPRILSLMLNKAWSTWLRFNG